MAESLTSFSPHACHSSRIDRFNLTAFVFCQKINVVAPHSRAYNSN